MRTHRLIITVLLLVLAACASTPSASQSVSDLSQAGFYIYAFSEAYETQFGWTRTISFPSFNRHCATPESNSASNWNPVRLSYGNANGQSLELRISPRDESWDINQPADSIRLNVEWIPDRQGLYYIENGQTIVSLKDAYGMDVVISSSLDANTLAELIRRLSYYGPAPDTIANPWEAICAA